VQLDFEVMLVDDGGVIEPSLSVRESGDAMRTGHRVCPGE